MAVSLWYPANQASGTVHVGPFTFQATRDAEPARGDAALSLFLMAQRGQISVIATLP